MALPIGASGPGEDDAASRKEPYGTPDGPANAAEDALQEALDQYGNEEVYGVHDIALPVGLTFGIGVELGLTLAAVLVGAPLGNARGEIEDALENAKTKLNRYYRQDVHEREMLNERCA